MSRVRERGREGRKCCLRQYACGAQASALTPRSVLSRCGAMLSTPSSPCSGANPPCSAHAAHPGRTKTLKLNYPTLKSNKLRILGVGALRLCTCVCRPTPCSAAQVGRPTCAESRASALSLSRALSRALARWLLGTDRFGISSTIILVIKILVSGNHSATNPGPLPGTKYFFFKKNYLEKIFCYKKSTFIPRHRF